MGEHWVVQYLEQGKPGLWGYQQPLTTHLCVVAIESALKGVCVFHVNGQSTAFSGLSLQGHFKLFYNF